RPFRHFPRLGDRAPRGTTSIRRAKRALGVTLDEKQSYRNHLWRAEESPEGCLWTAGLPPRSEEHPLREATRLSEGEERELIRRSKGRRRWRARSTLGSVLCLRLGRMPQTGAVDEAGCRHRRGRS